MTPIHSLARSMFAPIFVTGGLDAVRRPAPKVPAAEVVTDFFPDIPATAKQLVRLNGAVQLGAGALLFFGKLPRLSSAALAVSMVPTTLTGHRFWEEGDPAARSQQKIQFMKNLACIGGLVLAATDRNGSPSLTWRAKRAAGSASDSLSTMRANLGSQEESIIDRAGAFGERIAGVALPAVEKGLHLASSVGSTVSDRASHIGESVSSRVASLV